MTAQGKASDIVPIATASVDKRAPTSEVHQYFQLANDHSWSDVMLLFGVDLEQEVVGSITMDVFLERYVPDTGHQAWTVEVVGHEGIITCQGRRITSDTNGCVTWSFTGDSQPFDPYGDTVCSWVTCRFHCSPGIMIDLSYRHLVGYYAVLTSKPGADAAVLSKLQPLLAGGCPKIAFFSSGKKGAKFDEVAHFGRLAIICAQEQQGDALARAAHMLPAFFPPGYGQSDSSD